MFVFKTPFYHTCHMDVQKMFPGCFYTENGLTVQPNKIWCILKSTIYRIIIDVLVFMKFVLKSTLRLHTATILIRVQESNSWSSWHATNLITQYFIGEFWFMTHHLRLIFHSYLPTPFSASTFGAVTLPLVFGFATPSAAVVTPGIDGRFVGGVLASGELRICRRNLRS